MQIIAQTWLVFQLTHSATKVGLLTAAQFLPILLFAPVGGLLADRLSKRRIMYVTQTSMLLLAIILTVLTLSHHIEAWMIFLLAAAAGTANAVDNPTRQTFMLELVGRERLANAVTMTSVLVNLTRVIGPAIAGIFLTTVGAGYCFLFNALSYLPVLVCLALMRSSEMHLAERAVRAKGQLRDGFRYVWHTPLLRNILLMMVVIGTLSYEFQVVLPVLASRTFHSGASMFSLLMSAMGLGSVIGGIAVANRQHVTARLVLLAALSFGIIMLLVAGAPTRVTAVIGMFLVGIASIAFTALASSTLQLNADPAMRGRVMSLWTMALLGSTPIGGPIIGWICEHYSPRWGLIVGGVAAIMASIFGLGIARRARRQADSTQLATASEAP